MSRKKPKKRAVPAWPADPKTDPMYPFGGPPPLNPEDFMPAPADTTKTRKSTWGQLKKDYR